MSIVPLDRTAEQYPLGWLVGQLPIGMRDDDLLVRFTTIFERVAATLRTGADGTELVADRTVTTPGMLNFMSRWFGIEVLDPELPIASQRRVLSALGRALPLRGTATGLQLLLEAIVGDRVFVSDPGGVFEDGQADPHEGVVEVRLPSTGHLRDHELRALIRDEVPAHLGVRIVIGRQDEIGPGYAGGSSSEERT